MNEIQTNNFDYSVLDSSTAEYLKDRENSMSKTLEKTSEKLGEDLYKAQQKLADHNGGVFEEWYTALGFKSRNVYNFINRHKYVLQNLQDPSDLETFQELGSSLQIEMSKPSANHEINQKVFDGDIKTHKEYKELEKKYKEQQERLEKAESMNESTKNWFHDVSNKLKKRDEENEILQSKLEDAENAPPEVIYKERVETVVPDDYDKLKRDSERFKAISDSQENKNIKLQQEIDQLKREISNVDEKSKKYDQLNEEINKMNGRLTEGQLRIKNQKLVYDLVKKSEALISEVAPLTYSISHLGVDDNKYAKEPLIKIAENLEDISSRIRKQLNENKIIEVE